MTADPTDTGRKMVPLEPTDEMLDAGIQAPNMKLCNDIIVSHQLRTGEQFSWDRKDSPLAQAYRAMLAAAPADTVLAEPLRFCTGCGWQKGRSLGPTALACCPDNRYRTVSEILDELSDCRAELAEAKQYLPHNRDDVALTLLHIRINRTLGEKP